MCRCREGETVIDAWTLPPLDSSLKGGARTAAEIAPDNAMVQDTLGWIYYRKGIYGTATKYLQAALAREPTPQREFHLAMSYLKAGDTNLGAKMVQAALKEGSEFRENRECMVSGNLEAGN